MKKHFVNLPVLETKRLILRPVQADDYKAVFDFASDPDVAKYTSWDAHKTIEDSKVLVRFITKRYADNKPSNWAVILKENNQLIGVCGFVSYYSANKRAEIAFAIRKDCWNKGYMTEGVAKTIEFGFNEIKLNRIEAYCDAENDASAKVLEKCGMKCEGILKQYAYKGSSFRDMKSYAVLAGEYFKEGV